MLFLMPTKMPDVVTGLLLSQLPLQPNVQSRHSIHAFFLKIETRSSLSPGWNAVAQSRLTIASSNLPSSASSGWDYWRAPPHVAHALLPHSHLGSTLTPTLEIKKQRLQQG